MSWLSLSRREGKGRKQFVKNGIFVYVSKVFSFLACLFLLLLLVFIFSVNRATRLSPSFFSFFRCFFSFFLPFANFSYAKFPFHISFVRIISREHVNSYFRFQFRRMARGKRDRVRVTRRMCVCISVYERYVWYR